jgi:hypothetical protein
MGVVYKARQLGLNRLVALKVILGAGHAGPGQLARFRAEAAVAALLQHPHIVQVFEVGEHAGLPFFSLELVEGGSLADRLRGEPQRPQVAAELVRVLALAVQHAHDRGVIHRDLKPANVLLSAQGPVPEAPASSASAHVAPCLDLCPKVADFGLAKHQTAGSGVTASGAILGTPSYMAPEQAAGDGAAIGPATDVYALGAILYELLTGRPPFRSPALMDTVLQVLHDDPVPPSRLQPRTPRDLETICLKCLAKRPEQRYASAAALAEDLRRSLDGEPIAARPVPAAVRAWKWARRHPARAVILFLLAVPIPALLGVMVYLWAEARAAQRGLELETAAAERARKAADRERELAQGYLRNALGTMDRILDRVGEERLARVPAVQEGRSAILADALAFYETLLRLDHTDPAVQHQTAQTYARIARVSLLAGRNDQSARAAQGAVDLFRALADQSPDRPAYRNDLAQAYLFLGHARVLTADFAGGQEAYRKGAEAAETLAAEYPQEAAYRATAADCRRSLGFFFAHASSGESETHFAAAVRLAEEVHRQHPESAEYRSLLASTLGSYAQLLVIRNRLAEAEPLVTRGMELARVPRDSLPRTGLARTGHDQAALTLRVAAASVYLRTGRRDQGRAAIREAITAVEELLAGQAQPFPYRLQAAQAYQAHARILRADKDLPGAVQATGRAAELYDQMAQDFPVFKEPSRAPWFQIQRAVARTEHASALLDAGRWQTAEPLVAELQKTPGLTGAHAYNVACLCARLAGTAEERAREGYVARAMDWLRKAARTGYPATAAQVEHVRARDPDLVALRGTSEFQTWAQGLEPGRK